MKLSVDKMIADIRKGGDHIGINSDDGSEKGYYGMGGKSLDYDIDDVGRVTCILGEKEVNGRFGFKTTEVLTFKLDGKRIAYAKLKKLIG